jgi:hypothetical protein
MGAEDLRVKIDKSLEELRRGLRDGELTHVRREVRLGGSAETTVDPDIQFPRDVLVQALGEEGQDSTNQ